MITAFKPSKPERPRTHCLKQNKRMKKEDSFALMMKTPKETPVLTAFEKPTAIWDIKLMEDVPQLAVQDLKTTCSEKKKTSTQQTLQQ